MVNFDINNALGQNWANSEIAEFPKEIIDFWSLWVGAGEFCSPCVMKIAYFFVSFFQKIGLQSIKHLTMQREIEAK